MLVSGDICHLCPNTNPQGTDRDRLEEKQNIHEYIKKGIYSTVISELLPSYLQCCGGLCNILSVNIKLANVIWTNATFT